MAETIEYKCPNCSGAIAFDSSIQKMRCPYCDSELEMESLKKLDEALTELPASQDLTWDQSQANQWQAEEADQMRVYACESCGGQLITDETTVATSCPYCDNPVVLKERLAGDLKPRFVLPFKLDKQAAKEALNKHLLGKRLLPKVFKDQNHIDEVKGIYVPFWLFDADVAADGKYAATMVRTWSDAHYNYTETNHYSLLRSATMTYERVPVDGSSKLDDRLMQSLEPFDFKGAVDFQTAYLAGYLADRYDQSADISLEQANQRIRQSTENRLANTVQGYGNVRKEDGSIRLNNGEPIYVLYPVWLLNTSWQKKKYTFAMNGQTGKFVGDLPLDRKAYWTYFLSIFLVMTLLIYGLVWLFYWMM